jgi:isocitrate dehydrogenase
MFQILIQKAPDSTCWHLKIKNSQHNHGPMVQPDRTQAVSRARERKSMGAQSQRKTFKIALIPGDGIGIEVTEAAKMVLQKLAQVSKKFDFHFEKFDWGTQQYHSLGYYMPTDAIERLKKFDAILFGAVGSPGKSATISL